MRRSIISFFVLVFFLLTNLATAQAQATKKKSAGGAKTGAARVDSIARARKHVADSIADARERKTDSTAQARKHATDSIKTARQAKTDSIATARKKKTDSTAAARKFKTSKKYTDSVNRAKTAKIKAQQKSREARTDSLQEVREHAMDSVAAVRKARSDSVKTKQKTRTDSLAKIKKYKSSKRYADSVTLTRRHRTDSIKAEQKDFRDSVAAVRKHSMDSAKKSRDKIMEVARKARTKRADSLKMVRSGKTDSLAKKKDAKAKVAKANEKKKQEALKLKLELKIKQKRQEWSNTSMLKKKWGPMRKTTQNSFTHYNYYYNANRKMDEAETNMRRVSKDNYDSLINIFPFDPNKDSSLLAADMDSIVHKVSVGIQIHDPRIKWGNDMYLLLGQAYYYKGSYENAATAFRYIIANDQKVKGKKEKGKSKSHASKSKNAPSIVESKKKSKLAFWQHKSVHNEAILWLARTYTTAGQIENAGSVLSLLEYDENMPDDLIARLAVEKAFAYMKERNYPEVSKQLSIALEDGNLPDWLLQRIAFLNGQLLQNNADYGPAAESFERVLDNYPKLEMDFYTRKYIAYNKLMAGQETADAMAPLKNILKDGKYANYYDQVYYLLGKLAAKSNKNDEAITYLTKSTTTPKATKKQKALSFAAMGDVYYATHKYSAAKVAYDSAAKYSSPSSRDKAVVAAVQRSSGLSEISGPLDIIHTQDSLLELAKLSKKEQQAEVRRHLRALEKQRQDSITRAETVVTASDEQENDKTEGTTSWYFSNPTLMAAGSSDFKRKWGSRPLTDNWRRAAAAPLAGGGKSGGGAGDDEEEETAKLGDNGLPTEESLLAKIPNTPQQKETAMKIQQKAYILLAKAYESQLEDHKQALQTLDTLDKRFPNHTQKEEELYLRYQIAIKQNRLDDAQKYASELLAKFPQSQYVNMLKPRQSESKGNESTSEVAAYFDETYKQLMGHQYTEALMRAGLAKKKYNNPVYKKRFEVVEAMAYAGTGDFRMADSTISTFIKNNPSDSLTPWAKAVKQYIAEVRDGGKPSWYKEGAVASASSGSAKPAVKEAPRPAAPPPPPPPPSFFPDAPAAYGFNAESEHYCIIVLPGLDSRTGALKQAIHDMDSIKYADAHLSLVIDLFSMSQGVVVIGKFPNAAQAKMYMESLSASTALSPYKPGEINLYLISANNYKKMFLDKTTTDYTAFYNRNYTK